MELKKYTNEVMLVTRIVFGVLFLMHGLMKFGVGSSMNASAFSMMWFAGVIEIIVGTLAIIGLFTVYISLLGAIEMLVAFVISHLPKGINPMSNGGELALLFFAAFLLMAFVGAGKYSLDKIVMKN